MFWVKVSYLVALVLVTPIHYTQVMGKSRVCSTGPPERIGTWELVPTNFWRRYINLITLMQFYDSRPPVL